MADPSTDVRCPACSRLLARRVVIDGEPHVAFEYGERYVVAIEEGRVGCVRCGSVVEVARGEVVSVRLGGRSAIVCLATGRLTSGPG